MTTHVLRARVAPKSLRRVGLLVAGIVTSLLAGCASMAGLQPQAQMGSSQRLHMDRSVAGVQLTPAAWPRSDWWKALGDAQLNALVDEALAGNPSIAAVDARVRIAQAQAGMADAQRKPTVGAKALYSGIAIPETLAPPPFGGHYLAANLWTLGGSYSPDLWGGHRAAWEAAVDQAHAAQVDAQAARLSLSEGVVQTYIGLGHAQALMAIAHQELKRAQTTRQLTAQRVKAGLDGAFALRQADAAVAAAQRGVEAVAEQQAQVRARLAALLGQGPDRGLQLQPAQTLANATLALPTDIPSGLLARRPDVVAARWRVEAAARGIAATKAQFYPNIDLSLALGLASAKLSTLFQAPSRFANLGPSLALPIFDGGRLRAGLSTRDAQFDAAVAQYDQTLVDAVHEVAQQVISMRALDAQIATQQQAVDAAQAAWGLGMQRYRGGLLNLLSVLDVQRSLLHAQQQMTDLRTQRLLAGATLAQALGGGFRAEGELMPPTSAPNQQLAHEPFFAPTTAH